MTAAAASSSAGSAALAKHCGDCRLDIMPCRLDARRPLGAPLSPPVEIVANSIDYPLAAAVCQYAQYDESKVAPLGQAMGPLPASAILMRSCRRGLRRSRARPI